ncbi:MAG: acylphosphatase [Candidatus Zixiibacteriota bacterium]
MNRRKVEMMISGVVQGVGFRYFVYRAARELGIVGWARNLPDGRVQVVAEGEPAHLEAFIDELRQGPRLAQVQDIRLRWVQADNRFSTFNIE